MANNKPSYNLSNRKTTQLKPTDYIKTAWSYIYDGKAFIYDWKQMNRVNTETLDDKAMIKSAVSTEWQPVNQKTIQLEPTNYYEKFCHIWMNETPYYYLKMIHTYGLNEDEPWKSPSNHKKHVVKLIALLLSTLCHSNPPPYRCASGWNSATKIPLVAKNILHP